MTNTGILFLCPICGKAIDNTHEIRWAKDYWEIGCPTPLIVEKPLAHCRLDGIEVKHG